MGSSIIVNIIEISVILLTFSQIMDFYWIKFQNSGRKLYQYATGLMIGLVGIALIYKKVVWVQYMDLDTRTVFLCLGALFFGKIPSATALAITTIYQIIQFSTWQTYCLDTISSVAAIASGLIFNYTLPQWHKTGSLKTVSLATITAQIIQYICISLIPTDHKADLMAETAIPVLVMMPLSTIGLARLMIFRTSSWNLMNKLHRSEDRFNKIALCTDDAFWEMDSVGRITYVSDGIEEIIGYTKQELEGRMPHTFIDDIDSRNRLLRYAHTSGLNMDELFESKLILRHRDGHNIYVAARGHRITDSDTGLVTGFIGIIHNITNQQLHEELQRHNEKIMREQNREFQKLNEELKEYNSRIEKTNEELTAASIKSKENDNSHMSFLANISQSINFTVTDIMRYSELMLDSQTSINDKQALLVKLNSASIALKALTTDIMDADRINHNDIKLNPTIGNIQDTFKAIYDYYYSRNMYLSKKPITLHQELDLQQEETIIKTDFLRLRQILTILMYNAYNFTQSGRITMECRRYSDNELIFSVSDTGVGVPETVYNTIFTPYNHTDQPFMKTAGLEHTGLSLSICKSLVEIMGGRIWFNSELSKGTTFHFTIPYNKASSMAVVDNASYNWSQYSALVIGQDRFSNILICEALLKTGIHYRNIIISDKAETVPSPIPDRQYNVLIIDEDTLDTPQVKEIIRKHSNSAVITANQNTYTAELCQKIDNKLKEKS